MNNLERKLGISLLERTSRRVTLTPAGSVLLEHGRVAVDGVAAAIGRARRAAAQADCLTVAVKPGAGTHLLKEIIHRCACDAQVPKVRLLFGYPGGPVAAIRSGRPCQRRRAGQARGRAGHHGDVTVLGQR